MMQSQLIQNILKFCYEIYVSLLFIQSAIMVRKSINQASTMFGNEKDAIIEF